MDKYDIIGTVGEGSYGVVLKSRHRDTEQIVAIKKFLETEEDINSRRMALREIRMLKKLRHENLVCLIEVFRTRKYFHLVFEFVDRTILDELEEQGEGLGESICRERIFQVIRGVRYCHSKHIIHRDVKPENVLVSNQGVVKLCDFGFARIMVTPGEPCTEYVATRWYRAPELLVTDVHYGPAVDIWAIGCLYSEMMTGKPLFPGDSDIDQLYRICKILGQPCYRHQQIISRNPAFREMNRNVADDTGRTLLKMYPNWPPIAIDFLAASMKMDPSSRPTSDELMKHTYFTHDKFSEKFLPKLRQKVLQEYQENPLLRKFQTEILSASEERKTDLFFERQQKKAAHAEVPRWKINLYDPYNKKRTSYLTLSRTSSDYVNSRTFLNSIDKNSTSNEKIKTVNHKHAQSYSKLDPKKLDIRYHNQSSENNEFFNKSPLKKKFEEVKSSVNENVDVAYDDKNCDNIKNIVEIHVDGPSPAPFQSLQSDNNRMHYNNQNILHPSINNLTFLNNNNKDIAHQRRTSQTLPSNQKIKDLSGTSLKTLQSMFNKSPIPLANPPREQLIRRIGRGLVLDVNQLGTGHEPVTPQQGTKTPPAWLNTAGYTTYKKHSVEQTTWTRLEQPGGNGERTLPSLTGNVSPFKNQRKKLQTQTIHPASENHHNNTPRDNSSKSQPPIRHINSNLPYM